MLRVTVSWLALTKVAECCDLLNVTVEAVMKPLPLMVSVSGPLLALAEEGDKLVITGTGFDTPCTVKLNGCEVPPGLGFVTVIGNAPADAKSHVGISALTCVVVTKAVNRGEPLKYAVAPGAKLVPEI